MSQSDNELLRTADYLAEAIDDELALAQLLGWTHIEGPRDITPNCWVYGRHGTANGYEARTSSGPCPRWRRSWEGAGQLIARCELMISSGPTGVMVAAGTNDFEINSMYADHPTRDDAIRYAMCKAAVSHLTNFKTGAAPRNAPHDAAA